MARIQLALNVSDVDESVDFYRRLFGVEPAVRRPGYANFVVPEPPLKLVLIGVGQDTGREGGSLNHLGVEVIEPGEVEVAEARLAGEGLSPSAVEDVSCCYATKTETWVFDPDGAAWEWYLRTGEADVACRPDAVPESLCCAGPAAPATGQADAPCACC